MANGGTEKKRRDASESQRKSRRVGISTTRAIGGWHRRLEKKEKEKHADDARKQRGKTKQKTGRTTQPKRKKEKKEMASNKTKQQQQQQQQQLVPVVFWSSPYQAQEVVNHWTKHFPRKT
jgi:hypothetical protein